MCWGPTIKFRGIWTTGIQLIVIILIIDCCRQRTCNDMKWYEMICDARLNDYDSSVGVESWPSDWIWYGYQSRSRMSRQTEIGNWTQMLNADLRRMLCYIMLCWEWSHEMKCGATKPVLTLREEMRWDAMWRLAIIDGGKSGNYQRALSMEKC